MTTPSATPSIVDIWKQQFQQLPAVQERTIPGTGRSFPVLARGEHGTEVRYFFHYAQMIAPDAMEIGPPDTWLAIDPETDEVLTVVTDTSFDLEPFEPVVHQLGAVERTANARRIQRLKELYDDLVPVFPDPLPDPAIGREFWDLLGQIVSAPLLGYYVALSPEFVRWLQGE